jgi:hypothetical protein
MTKAEMNPRANSVRCLLAAGLLLASPSLAHAHGYPEGLVTVFLTFVVVILASQFGLDYLAFKRRIFVEQPFAATIFCNFAYLGILIAGIFAWSEISDPLEQWFDSIPSGTGSPTYGAYLRDYDHFFVPVIVVALGIAMKTGVLRWLFEVKRTWRVASVFVATSLMSLVFAAVAGWIAVQLTRTGG